MSSLILRLRAGFTPSTHVEVISLVGNGAMTRAKRIIAGAACIVALSGCGTSEDEQTSMNEFWG
ncbi:MAG: hypothetical protein ACTHYA_09825, partial [Ancrocorticia populi]|uniref:hypothetical protein n=1 Tax=Ancrocorticia populi TaxID=2175228 RepID=UPI003F903FD5